MRTITITTGFVLLFISLFSHANYSLTHIKDHNFLLLDNHHQAVVDIHGAAFKPNWQWMGMTKTHHRNSQYHYTLDNGNITWDVALLKQNNNITINSQLAAKKTVPLTYIALAFTPKESLHQGYIELTNQMGEVHSAPIPLGIQYLHNIVAANFFDKHNKLRLSLGFNQPVNIHNHSQMRIKLADLAINEHDKNALEITLTTPKDIQLYTALNQIPSSFAKQDWFIFTPKNYTHSGEIGMRDWLKKPRSFLRIKNQKVINADSTYKAWGTNVNYIHVAPNKTDAKKRTAFFSKYGINSVRLHKLTNPSWEGLGTTHSASEYDPEKLARFDYWLHTLREQGINYGFSPIWDLMVFEKDREKLIAYDEMVKANPKKPVTTGLVWFAKDVQDLHIDTIVNLLTHKNPHTGLSYAQDPALAYIEIQNEENIFFYTFIDKVRRHPTYHQLLAEQFSDWLIQKYETHSRLVTAWGASAIDTFSKEGGLPNEQLDKRNITPVISPWLYDNQATRSFRAKRLQDSAEFLLQKQQEYYARAEQAIRATGYQGLIISSNWQAGYKGAHFLNLLSDTKLGIVDRHNYQGGAQGVPPHEIKSGFSLNNYTMLGDPGSGLLSTGMQQINNYPFMISEWLAVVPSEYAAADTSIVAAYGFGLQGWDMSYHFASDGNEFSSTLGAGNNKFNTRTPVGIGLYPVLSRMVLRGDIKEAEPVAIRRLNKEQAIKNSYDFSNTVEQQHDIKSFGGDPHYNALAAGKVLIDFTQKPSTSTISDWQKKYLSINADNSKTITSSTGQLRWTYTDNTQQGFVEINTQGTQGIIGFAKNKNYVFDDIHIQPHSPYSVILSTAKSPTGTLSTDNKAIIMAIARAHNTDMNIKGSLIVNAGKAPIILEPVTATLTFKREATIEVLDHDGIPTGKTYPLVDGKFTLDTGRDKTLYYLVNFTPKP